MRVDVTASTHFSDLNEQVRACPDKDILINGCMGHRYIASGLKGKRITINGIPGNALGAYLDGCTITVNGSAQDALGDTMNAGTIYIKGDCGDAAGYGMRGGKIFIHGNVGYRAGIHMKAYQEHKPVIVVGGKAGSFLGEYQAGGTIVVLGMGKDDRPVVGNFCGTGMHGGKMFLRMDELPKDLPAQVCAAKATAEDMEEIRPYLEEFCAAFGDSIDDVTAGTFYVLSPNTLNPYKQLYTHH